MFYTIGLVLGTNFTRPFVISFFYNKANGQTYNYTFVTRVLGFRRAMDGNEFKKPHSYSFKTSLENKWPH